MSKKLSIKQIRSAIGRKKSQKRTLEALGIRRLHHEVIHKDSTQIRGMIKKVSHLVDVQETNQDKGSE